MRPDERRDVQVAAIVVVFAAIILLRLILEPDPGPMELVPVLAASWWFGRRGALVAGAVAAAVLVAAAIVHTPVEAGTRVLRVPLTVIPGYLLALLREESDRRTRELAGLRVIGNALAPMQPPDLPLLEVATRYVPAERGVAGDFYLVAPGHNNSTVVVLGDVVGKGIDAARRATFVRATLSASAPYSDDPVHLLRIANAELIRQHGVSSDFITMLCVVVRADSRLVWATAGHPPPISLASGQAIGTAKPSYPLGIAPELPASEHHAVMPQAGILLYTDGVTDARPRRQTYEPFGPARLARLISELRDPTPDQAVDEVVRAAQRFSRGSLPDDVCLVALRSKLSPAWRRTMAKPPPDVAVERPREQAPQLEQA